MGSIWRKDRISQKHKLPGTQSALKFEKSAISKVQKHIICIFKNGKKSLSKKSIFVPEKSPNIAFLVGSFKFFSCAKIDFLPFLKMQIMYFCTLEIALFPILEHCERSGS